MSNRAERVPAKESPGTAAFDELAQAVLAAPVEQLSALLVLIAARLAEPHEVTTATERPEETLLTANDVAKRLGVKPSFVYDLARRGEIEYQPLGRYKRFTPDAVERYLANE